MKEPKEKEGKTKGKEKNPQGQRGGGVKGSRRTQSASNDLARSPGSIAAGHSFTPRNPAGGVGGSAGAELNGGR